MQTQPSRKEIINKLKLTEFKERALTSQHTQRKLPEVTDAGKPRGE